MEQEDSQEALLPPVFAQPLRRSSFLRRLTPTQG